MGLKVLVTGGSGGIGRETVLRFSKDGHEVFITGRSEAKLEETVNIAKGAGGGAVHKAVGDVAVEADVQRNYEEAIKALGRIDVLVLNAGATWTGQLEDHSAADFDNIFNPNVRGAFLWLKAALPAFKKQSFGQIVFLNSVFGLSAVAPLFSIYVASNFALTGMAEALRLEVKGTGIKVASVCAGAVDTSIWVSESHDKTGTDARKEFALDLALSPLDIANAIAGIAYQGAFVLYLIDLGMNYKEVDVSWKTLQKVFDRRSNYI